jgi:Flp pilus assembly CpaE family ATPase
MFEAAHQRVLVADPSVAGARDALRYLSIPVGVESAGAPLLVLNMVGVPGGLDPAKFAEATGREPDLVIPYAKGALRLAADLGEPAAATNTAFARLIETLASRAGSVHAEGVGKRRRFWSRR